MNASAQKACFHAILREAWPRHAAKRAARAAGAPVATAKAWVAGRCIPSAETLLRMAERDERLAAAIRRRLDALDHPRAAPAGADGGAAARSFVAPPGGAALALAVRG